MKKLLLAFAFFCMLLLGCGSSLDKGTVTGHKFVAAHNDIVPMYIPDGNGGITIIYVPDPIPDRWYVQVKDGKQIEWINVSKLEHDSLHIGETWERKR